MRKSAAPAARKSKGLSAQDWATVVNKCLGSTVKGIIEIGAVLLQAKDELDHGQWGSMFAEAIDNVDPATVKIPIHFGIRTAQRYMFIAEKFQKRQDMSFFPPTLTVLEELAHFSERVITKALKDGRVFADMTMENAYDLNLSPKELREKQAAKKEAHHEQVKRDLEDLIGGPSTYVKDSRRIAVDENLKRQQQEREGVLRMQHMIIDLGFKEAARRFHPDKPGGNTKDFQALTAARDQLNRFL